MHAGVSSVGDVRVAPLVKSTWDQFNAPGGSKRLYNYYTPNNWYCGCVATAGAQVMRYHEFPTNNIPALQYPCAVNGTWQFLTMKGGVYNWGMMPLIPTSAIDDDEREAIGRLTYDVGVVSSMQYFSNGSGAWNDDMINGFRDAFGYASALTYDMNLSGGTPVPANNAAIRNALLASLDARLPAVLGIDSPTSGHSVVADGYGYNSGSLFVHLNMGWGGSQNAWFNLESFDVSTHHFNLFTDVSYNISPTNSGEWITGRTLDGHGAPLPGSHVAARDTSGGATFTALSGANGIYALNVPSATATYALSATNGPAFAPEIFVSITPSVMCDFDTPFTGIVGNSWGNDLALSGIGAPSGVAATQGTHDDRVTVSWQSLHPATSYKIFRRHNDVSGGAVQIGTALAPPFDDTTALRGFKYFYWVKAVGTDGDSSFSTPAAQGWRTPYTFAEALKNSKFEWTTGGDLPWFTQAGMTRDGVAAAQSGAIGNNQTSTLETTVSGPGTLSFWWAVSSELNYDWLRFYIGGTLRDSISGSATWAKKTYAIEPGTHTLKWSYEKDLYVAGYFDCAWLDEVEWTLDVSKPELLGYADWLAYYVETDSHASTNNWLTGCDPTDPAARFLCDISITNGTPHIVWRPDLGKYRDYTVEGKSDLTHPWGPTNTTTRFFRVKVVR